MGSLAAWRWQSATGSDSSPMNAESQVSIAAPSDTLVRRTHRYWRAACALAGAHTLGFSWPPPGVPYRDRPVGHWGAIPGIAWIVAQLAALWRDDAPLTAILGTGHATSFILAHQALRERWNAARISGHAMRHGQPGGEPTELIGFPDGVLHNGGELGHALAVSQAVARARPDRLVVAIVGDGECETPGALAAFAHHEVLLGGRDSRWLPVVNANGARMGGPARFTPASLASILQGAGFTVLTAEAQRPAAALAAAAEALQAAMRGLRVVLISVSRKGWPAPNPLLGHPFTGADAHKMPHDLELRRGETARRLGDWIAHLARGCFGPDGTARTDIQNVARRLSFSLDAGRDPSRPAASWNTREVSFVEAGLRGKPVAAVDALLAKRRIDVFCPDEARSNGLHRCIDAGLLTEVLAEETCMSWAIGTAEAGRPCVFATYEAFAPKIASLVAQHSKLMQKRKDAAARAVIVLVTSLSWANSPSHQNTDLVATFMARPSSTLRVLCPIGGRSAALRASGVLDRDGQGIFMLICSKQPLLDLPDPGSSLVEIAIGGAANAEGTFVAAGDVCVSECIGAMTLAARSGVATRVVAVVDLSVVAGDLSDTPAPEASTQPLIGAVWCAPVFLESTLWRLGGCRYPIHGYREAAGATAWETLRENRMDRYSLLEALGDRLGADHLKITARDAAQSHPGTDVEPFETTRLCVRAAGPDALSGDGFTRAR